LNLPVAAESTAAAAGGEKMDVFAALKEVLKTALVHDGIFKGLREATKALSRRQAHLCVLASDCDEPAYTRLVVALCEENGVPLIKVPEAKQLGEWVGLCTLDDEGNARKVCGCACAVVQNYGATSEALTILLEYLKTRGASTEE